MASCRKDIEKSAKYYFATCERCKKHLQIRIWLLFLVEVETSLTHHMISKKKPRATFLSYFETFRYRIRRVSSTLRGFLGHKKAQTFFVFLTKEQMDNYIYFSFFIHMFSMSKLVMSWHLFSHAFLWHVIDRFLYNLTFCQIWSTEKVVCRKVIYILLYQS